MILLAAAVSTPVAADDYIVAFPVPSAFWRPASPLPPDLVLTLSGNEIRVATPCFISELIFELEDHKAVFKGEPSWSRNDTTDCAYSQSAFDSFKSSLRRTAGFRKTETGLVLEAKDGSDIVALEPIQANGIEFRELTVTSLRQNGKLVSAKRMSPLPEFVFFGGHIEGTMGCGPLFGSTYRNRGGSRFKLSINYLDCGNDRQSARLADHIRKALDGMRSVEMRGQDYVLRDRHDQIQIVLSPIP